MRVLLTLQYLGTRYAGWQTQANATGVQQVVEAALTRLYGGEIRIEGAGRTDAGVHAAAQRAHFDAPFEIPPRGLVLGLNNILPHDIRISGAETVPDTFHCRFDAKQKTYAYNVWNAEAMDVFRWETHAHMAQPLDEVRMARVARDLLGTHDFKAFTVLAPEVSSTVRTIHECTVVRGGDEDAAGAHTVTIRVTADGFLRYMVRRIAGSLIEIGRGKLDPGALLRALEPTFAEARWTAPAKGLVLERIGY
jgi:tRNA pseudouridine38-40 synthase